MANKPLLRPNDNQVNEKENKEKATKKAQNDAVAYMMSNQFAQNQPPMEQSAPGLEEENPNQEDSLIAAYIKKFNKKPQMNKDGNPVFIFESDKQASKFFNDMAKQKFVFGMMQIDSNGNPTGNVKVSFGDGEYHEAYISSEKIQEFREKLVAWSQNPNDEAKSEIISMMKNPTKDFREKLQPIYEKRGKESQAGEKPENAEQMDGPKQKF